MIDINLLIHLDKIIDKYLPISDRKAIAQYNCIVL